MFGKSQLIHLWAHLFFYLLGQVWFWKFLLNPSVLSLDSLVLKFMFVFCVPISLLNHFPPVLFLVLLYCLYMFSCSSLSISGSPFLSNQLLDVCCIPLMESFPTLTPTSPILCDPCNLHRCLCIWRNSHIFQTLWTDFNKERLSPVDGGILGYAVTPGLVGQDTKCGVVVTGADNVHTLGCGGQLQLPV